LALSLAMSWACVEREVRDVWELGEGRG